MDRDPADQARLRQIADEQAALRRVATLVARGAAPEEVFTAVAEEVEQLLPVDQAALHDHPNRNVLRRQRPPAEITGNVADRPPSQRAAPERGTEPSLCKIGIGHVQAASTTCVFCGKESLSLPTWVSFRSCASVLRRT